MVHIPYKGTSPGVVDLLAGQVSVMAPNLLTALPHIKAGKLRALAVTSAKRSEGLPEVPTIAESGLPGYDSTQWYGVLAPRAPRARSSCACTTRSCAPCARPKSCNDWPRTA